MSINHKPAPVAWGFVFLSSGVAGILFAVLTIFGWIHGWEGRTALAILVVVGFVVFRRDLHRPVFHGFIVGFLSGLFAVELQAAFLPTYFANNPDYAAVEIPFGLPARLATAIFAPMQGIIAGSLTAGIVWILGKLSRQSNSAADS